MIELHAIVKGRVQGVGFRAKVHFFATQLGLRGTVCNLADGSVEIFAQGSQEQLQSLINRIKHAFDLSGLETEFLAPKQTFDDFSIIYKNRVN